ncbi:MAG: chromate transporter, chromate ion transporter family [Gemmatimonadetes bacterium]|nr:chromate transporter, chromate ion transporter family [Gemmatimonadota bacterium]
MDSANPIPFTSSDSSLHADAVSDLPADANDGSGRAKPGSAQARPRASLGELARVFLKLGTVAFGGPAAHVAMMRDEVVARRRWMSDEAFLDYLGATNLIPGPNSTELAIHVGQDQAGWRGLLVAGACFILPAAFLATAAAWAYVRFGSLPRAAGLLYGVKPVVIAVVAQALWSLGRTALRDRWLVAVAVGALAALALGTDELAVLALAGAVCAARHGVRARESDAAAGAGAFALPLSGGLAAAGTAGGAGLWALFGVFLKIGSVLFGSGYVLLAFLRADLVQRLHWITERQLIDAVAVGQVTPGPVFTTATFVGYLVAGGPGAAVATLGIFLPAFVFVALSARLLPRLRRSPAAGAVLDGVNAASLALMAAVTAQLARAALVDAWTVALAVLAALLLLRFRVNSAWLVLGGAALGLLLAGR